MEINSAERQMLLKWAGMEGWEICCASAMLRQPLTPQQCPVGWIRNLRNEISANGSAHLCSSKFNGTQIWNVKLLKCWRFGCFGCRDCAIYQQWRTQSSQGRPLRADSDNQRSNNYSDRSPAQWKTEVTRGNIASKTWNYHGDVRTANSPQKETVGKRKRGAKVSSGHRDCTLIHQD